MFFLFSLQIYNMSESNTTLGTSNHDNKGYENSDDGISAENTNSTNIVQHNTTRGKPLNTDQMVESINKFGMAQKKTMFVLCFMMFPPSYQYFIMLFIGNDPPWTCLSSGNDTLLCNTNRTYTVEDTLHSTRCLLPKNAWKFTKESTYSIVTEVCSLM